MTVQILSRRSSVLFDRPFPTRLGAGELALNNNPGDPGLYFADNTASPSTGLIKVGPTFIGSTAPNTPAAGYSMACKGESWLDTASTHIHKIFDGTNWQTPKSVVSVGTARPANPENGQLHYDRVRLLVYDALSAAWRIV